MLTGLLLIACSGPRPSFATGPFRDARAVAIDPTGRAYVVDGDRGLCRAVAAGWTCVSGSDDVRLVDPVALDASDALTVLVADRAGRIVRFDREGVVRDVLVLPPEASRTERGRPFAPVAVVRDALGRTLGLDPALGIVRWDAARQFAVLVPAERLPRGSRALARDGDAFVVLGEGRVVRYDAFGTETGTETVTSDAMSFVQFGTQRWILTPRGLQGLGTDAPLTIPAAVVSPVGSANHGSRTCWLTRADLMCER
ncbi:MAG TPA: hypothetical protein VD948_02990 [Rhodothermales bacterium]|nr:hypothetical protein [Rhodothermales bacterium]